MRGVRGTARSFALLGAVFINFIAGTAGRGEEVPTVKAAAAPGGIVAIVNDDVITQAELDLAIRRERSGLERTYSPAVVERELPKIQRMTLDRMIETRLVLQLVKKEEEKQGRPYVTEADVDQEIKDEWKNLQDRGLKISTMEELFRFWREMYGAEREDLRKYIRDLLSVQFYLQRHVFTPHAFVSPQELRAHYLKNMKEFTTPVAVSFRQIKVPRTHAQAEYIVGEVERGLKGGADFCELARKYDEEALQGDPESACRLWTKTFEELKKWHKPIPDVLQKRKKGETPELGVPTAVGIHFFMVEDVIEGAPRPFSEVQEEITRRIRMARNQEQMAQFFTRLRKKSQVVVFLPPLPPEPTAPPRSLPAVGPARNPVPDGKQAPPREGGGGGR